MVEERGAEKVFDYNDPECAKQIYEYTKGNLKLVFDTIGGIEICMNALSKGEGCKYGTILLNEIPREDVVSGFPDLFISLWGRQLSVL
jgi:hypothetical protein